MRAWLWPRPVAGLLTCVLPMALLQEINAQKSIYILTCNDDIGGSSAGRAAGKMDTAQESLPFASSLLLA